MKNKYLTERERYQIEALYKTKTPVKEIAQILGKCKATIYNELKRGMTTLLNSDLIEYETYLADVAQRKAEYNATNKGRDLKIGNDYKFATYVREMLLEKKYSPYALLQNIQANNLSFKTSVCKNTIYNYIRLGLFEGVSMSSLPSPRTPRKERIKRRTVSLNNAICRSIEERHISINKRENYGHWEMDTVVSGHKKKGALLVFTERMTREEEIYIIPSKSASDVVACINSIEKRIGIKKFKERYKTITCDNGVEFLDSVGVITSINKKSVRTDLYYCHPYRSCERGSNENANKLIRRWIPKGADISRYSNKYIKQVQTWINNYPRELFGGMSSLTYKKSLGIK